MPTDFAPRLAHKFQFHTKPAPGFDGAVNCEAIELDPSSTKVSQALAPSW
jgi:hypothetical protein